MIDLNGDQFMAGKPEYMMTRRTTGKIGGSGEEEYHLFHRNPGVVGQEKFGLVGYLTAEHPGTWASYYSPRDVSSELSYPAMAAREGWETGHYGDLAGNAMRPAAQDYVKAYAAGQPKLFGSHFEREPSSVGMLMSGAEHRHMVPQMLGVAENYSASHWGRSLVPSHDLSAQSLAMVQRLQGRGLVDEGEHYEKTNSLAGQYLSRHQESPEGLQRSTWHRPHETVPDYERRQGSRLVRSMLSGKPQFEPGELPFGPLRPQGEQLKLPGFEDF